MNIDLHTHTTCSDGTLTPKELMFYAKEKGLDVVALSDHDCIRGLAEASQHAKDLGIKLINAIEFAGFYIDRELHILGLFVDVENKEFVEIVDGIENGRLERNVEMCRRFTNLGMPMTIEDLNGGNPYKVVTRSHFAEFLVNNGYMPDKESSFKKYLLDGCETYLPREYYNTKEIIDIIHKGGGIAVLAHPTLYRFSKAEIETAISTLKSEGLDGVEGYYSTYSKQEREYVLSLASKYDLVVTGGSDYHGDTKPGLDLKDGYGSLTIPSDILDTILEKYNYSL